MAEPHRDLGLFFLSKSADTLPTLLPDGGLDADLAKTIGLLRAARAGAFRDQAIAHFRQFLDKAPAEDDFSGFLQKVIATAEGEDATLEGVFTMAAAEALQRADYGLAEKLYQELLDLVGKPRQDGVRDRLEEVRRLCRTEARIHHERANLLWATQQAPRAIEGYQAALAADPRLEKAHYNLGMALYENGDTQQAYEHIREFLDLRQHEGSRMPDFPESSPGALEQRLQFGDVAKKMAKVEQEAAVLLVKLQTFLHF
jgi:tetratricopeptide (TPR) repeat protein